MPLISYKFLDGEIPKWANDLLPNQNAQLAMNCDFADGKLSAMKGGELLRAMANNPVKGIYTEDGLLFYTWTQETLAFKSPIIDDANARVYYLTPSDGTFRVTTTAGMAADGPSPVTSWKVGVPRPTVAPTLKTLDRTTLPDYQNATFSATAWWDYGGTKYSEATVALTTTLALRAFAFVPPALPGSPPAGLSAVLVVRLQIKDQDNSDAVLMDMTIRAASTARSSAFPGGVEGSLTLASSGTAGINLVWGPTEARAYTYTYENTWNEESAPAPPATISPSYVQDVSVAVTAGVFTDYRPFSNYNIYRTYGTNSTYVRTEVTGTAPNFVDSSTKPGSVGIALETTDWYPPQDGLEGIELMAGGWFVTFKNNMLYKHAPYRPHAVPYSEPFPTNIRGVKEGQSGLVVTCASGIYLVSGAAPSQAGPIPLSAPQPGISQRSMTKLDGAVAAASQDGIVLITGSLASMDASQKLFSRDKWRERYSDILDDFSMRFAFHDGMLVVTSNTQSKGFVLRLDENAGAFSRIEQRMDSTFVLPITDSLYYSVGADVYRFRAGAALTFDWWSKEFVFTYDVSFGAARIRTTGTINVKVYADGVLWHEKDVTSGFFRIPPKRAQRWSVRFGGTGTVHDFQMAQSMQELKRA